MWRSQQSTGGAQHIKLWGVFTASEVKVGAFFTEQESKVETFTEQYLPGAYKDYFVNKRREKENHDNFQERWGTFPERKIVVVGSETFGLY